MADYNNLFQPPPPMGPLTALLFGNQPPQTGLGGFMQGAQSPGAMALSQPPAAAPGINSAVPPPVAPMSNAGAPATAPSSLPAPTAPQPGLFGKGGAGWKILGALSDGLSVAGGGKPTYSEAQQKATEDANTNASALQKMLMQYGINVAEHARNRDYDNANPTTPESVIAAQTVGSASPQQQAIYSKGYNITNPLVATGPNGSTYIPRETIAAGMAGQPIGGGAIPPVTGATYGSGTPMGGTFTDPGSGRSFRRVAPGDTPQSWQEVGGAAPGGPQTFP